MKNRKILHSFSTESLLLIDEIENAILNHILDHETSKQDEGALRKIANHIATYLNTKLNIEITPLDECFPSLDILASAETFSLEKYQNETNKIARFTNLLNNISSICQRELSNSSLNEAIQVLLKKGNELSTIASKLSQSNDEMPPYDLFIKANQDLWHSRISKSFSLDETNIEKLKHPNETYPDFFRRLSTPPQPCCYLVILRTSGDDPQKILNAAEHDFFAEGDLFASQDEANDFIFSNKIEGRPLCMKIDLDVRNARKLLNNRDDIKPHIKSVNEAPIMYSGKEFTY